jgi:beta-glucosidase
MVHNADIDGRGSRFDGSRTKTTIEVECLGCEGMTRDTQDEGTSRDETERRSTSFEDIEHETALLDDIDDENTLLRGTEPVESELGTSRRTFLKATGAATATAAVGAGATGSAAAEGWGIDIEDTIKGMSLEQKVAQMTQVAVGTFDPESDEIPDRFGVDTLGEYFADLEIGSILSGGAQPPSFDPEEVVTGINSLQEYNLDHNDIPFLWGVDAVHGNGLLDGATVFPQRINMGATRNPELLERAASHTADSAAAMGAHWTFAPTNELMRDPRWGRFFEGISEDPLLQGEITKARGRGFESNDRLCSTEKHFAGYSISDNGNDRAHARTSMRDLRTNLLPPHRMALEAEPKTVMVNSGAVNGKPAHASSWLLRTLLRRRYGFDGVVLSDYNDLNRLIVNHDYVADFRAAVREAINAGVDVCMIGNGASSQGPVTFIETLVSLVEDDEVSEERIDESVRRVLELKGQLGLFEEPTVDESRIDDVLGGAQDVSEQLAKESMVLLKNAPSTEGPTNTQYSRRRDDAQTPNNDPPQDETTNPVLPLGGDEDVLLTGPGYDPELDIENRFLMQYGGWTLGWQGIQSGAPTEDGPRPRGQNIAEAMQDALDGELMQVRTNHRAVPFEDAERFGDDPTPNGDFGFTDQQESAVREKAADADAVVVVVGEGTHNEGFGDRDRLALPSAQQDIVAAVADEAPETPVVGVVLAGSPRGTTKTFDMLDAVLFAGQPGSDGGRAVAETLLGDYNPAGKLAFNWPRNVGKVVNHYNQYPPLDDQNPLFAFGHGLSYTAFEYSDLSVSPSSVSDPAETSTVTVSVDVENTGDRHGGHIVEVYNTQSYGSVLQPNRRLMGYERVALDGGESTTVEIEADLSSLAVVPGEVPGLQGKAIEAGEYELSINDQTTLQPSDDELTTTLMVENTATVTDEIPLPDR